MLDAQKGLKMKAVDPNDLFFLTEQFLILIKEKEKRKEGTFDITKEYYMALMQDLSTILAGDLSPKEIYQQIKKGQKIPDRQKLLYNISDLLNELKFPFTRGEILYDRNEDLMHFGKFYYHPKLQRTNPPSKYIMKETQEIELIESSPFFLELNPDFKMTQLVEYFIEQSKTQNPNKKGIRTQLSKMCQTYGIDFLLYLMDSAYNGEEGDSWTRPKSPRFLEEDRYIEEAKRLYYQRIGMLKEAGIYGIVPRRDRYEDDDRPLSIESE